MFILKNFKNLKILIRNDLLFIIVMTKILGAEIVNIHFKYLFGKFPTHLSESVLMLTPKTKDDLKQLKELIFIRGLRSDIILGSW